VDVRQTWVREADLVFYLVDKVLEGWRGRVQPIQVGVQGEIRERFPGRLVGRHLDRIEAEGALVAHRRRRHHRDSRHGAVAQLSPILQHPALRFIIVVVTEPDPPCATLHLLPIKPRSINLSTFKMTFSPTQISSDKNT